MTVDEAVRLARELRELDVEAFELDGFKVQFGGRAPADAEVESDVEGARKLAASYEDLRYGHAG